MSSIEPQPGINPAAGPNSLDWRINPDLVIIRQPNAPNEDMSWPELAERVLSSRPMTLRLALLLGVLLAGVALVAVAVGIVGHGLVELVTDRLFGGRNRG
jgi:hypothetical protein